MITDRSRSKACSCAVGVFVLILVSLFGVGCSTDAPSPDAEAGSIGAVLVDLDPEEFSAMVARGEGVVVNVHVPDEGDIEGTDLSIPFDQIVGHPDLPADRSTRLLLYCRSGRMSEEAGQALVAAGYTDVSHLDGGMVAWEATGRPIVRDPAP
jgi:phage shock protein E